MLVSREKLLERISKIFPFNLSDVESLKGLVEQVEVVFFDIGNLVYLQGASASNFYIIYEGAVEILVEKSQRINRLNILHAGNYFGEDVLNHNLRVSSARVIRNALLIKIPKDIFLDFIEGQPNLENAFLVISQTYLNLFNHKLDDLPNETLYYIGKPHIFSLAVKVFKSLILAFIPLIGILSLASNKWLTVNVIWGIVASILILLIFRLLWIYLEWKNDHYVITGNRVANLKKRLFNYDSKFETPLSAINHLELKKSLLGREMDFGNLVIRTYTGETTLNDVAMPSTVQSLLEYLMQVEKSKRRNEERESFEKIVTENIYSENTPLQVEPPIMDVFDSREKEDGEPVVVYRTHWIILLKKILFPLFGFLSLMLISLFFLANHFSFNDYRGAFVISGILITCMLLWLIYQFLDWRNDQYHITQNLVIDFYRKPFGTENKRTAAIQNIQSIRFERKGILGMLLNFGTVYIRVGDEELTFDKVPNPAEVQKRLFQVLETANAKIKKSELTDQQFKVAEWIDTYNRVKDKKTPKNSNN